MLMLLRWNTGCETSGKIGADAEGMPTFTVRVVGIDDGAAAGSRGEANEPEPSGACTELRQCDGDA